MGVQINELVSEQLLSIVRLDADWNSNPDDVSFGLELFVRSLELHLTVRSVFPPLVQLHMIITLWKMWPFMRLNFSASVVKNLCIG